MTLDFSQYRIREDSPTAEIPEEPGSGLDIGRHLARSGARIGETLAGLPGDVEKLAKVPLNWIAKHTKKYLGFGNPKTEEQLGAMQTLPTSQNIREKGKKLTGGYLEPQSEAEKAADEYLELATSLAIPGPKGAASGKLLKGLAKAGSLSGLATSTKYGLKAFGVDEDAANVASFASLAIPGLLKAANPKSAVSKLYKEAESLLPYGAKIASTKIVPSMQEITKTLSRGTSTPSKSAAIKTAKDIIEKSKSGMIEVEELMAFKRDINELMKDPQLLRRSEKFLPVIGKEVDELLENYGKGHPEWIKKYRLANEMYGGLARSEKASNKLKSLTKYVKNPFAAVALGMIPGVGFSKVVGAYLAESGARKGYEFMHRIFSNKSLRKHYGNIVKEASKDNTKATIQLLNRFDKEMDSEFPNIDWDQYKTD